MIILFFSFCNKVAVTGLTRFITANHIKVGAGSLISCDVRIMDTDFNKVPDADGKITNDPRRIKIGEHV